MNSCELTPKLTDAYFWRRIRARAGKHLRVAVIVDGPLIPVWVGETLRLLASDDAVELQQVFVSPGRVESGKPGGLCRIVDRISRKVADPGRVVEYASIPGLPSPAPLAERSAIEALGLDVLLRLDATLLEGEAGGLARLGVWSVHFGDPRQALIPFWREAYEKEPVTTVSLFLHTKRYEIGAPMATYAAPTLQGWFYTRNAKELQSVAPAFVYEKLLDMAVSGDLLAAANGDELRLIGEPRYPRVGAISAFLLRQAFRSAALRLRARGRPMRWFVAGRRPPNPFFEVPNIAGHGSADPFLYEHEGRDWLFVEDIPPNGKGRIVAREVHVDGFGQPVPVLERPYHVSYPIVFRDGDEIFMLPESSEDRTVQLHRATRFPYEWQLETVLYEGSQLVDTTPCYFGGLWYFFTTRIDPGMQTFLFYTSALGGRWKYHPRNPICSDARGARSAGALFRQDGRLVRPVQDCSVRYGYAIVLKEVLTLSPVEYEERTMEVITPTWQPGLLGTHTINGNGRIEVRDGLRFAP